MSDKKKTFVWIFGTSGVGKETLVRNMASDINHPVAQMLDLQNPAFSMTSVAIRGHQGREKLPLIDIFEQEIEENGADELLIKWQGKDCEKSNRVIELCQRRPNDEHKFIFLTADLATLKDHVNERWPIERWRSWDHVEDIEECLQVAQLLKEQGICFQWIEVTADGEYISIADPLPCIK